MLYFVTIDGDTIEVDLRPEGVFVGDRRVEAEIEALPGTSVRSLILNGISYRVLGESPSRGRWDLQFEGSRVMAEVVDERTRAIREMTGKGTGPDGPRALSAPMPGLVVKVEVAEGDTVEAGQGLIIVEAMKMENELRASGPARVGPVRVVAGQTVEKGQVLIDLHGVEATE